MDEETKKRRTDLMIEIRSRIARLLGEISMEYKIKETDEAAMIDFMNASLCATALHMVALVECMKETNLDLRTGAHQVIDDVVDAYGDDIIEVCTVTPQLH